LRNGARDTTRPYATPVRMTMKCDAGRWTPSARSAAAAVLARRSASASPKRMIDSTPFLERLDK
jgi:hypothetical protein